MEAQMAFNTWTYIDFHLIYIFIDIYNSKDMFLITTIYLFNSFKQLGRKKSKIKPKQKKPPKQFHYNHIWYVCVTNYKQNKPCVRFESDHSRTEQLRGRQRVSEQAYMSNGGFGLSGRAGLALPGRLEVKNKKKKEKGKGKEKGGEVVKQ